MIGYYCSVIDYSISGFFSRTPVNAAPHQASPCLWSGNPMSGQHASEKTNQYSLTSTLNKKFFLRVFILLALLHGKKVALSNIRCQVISLTKNRDIIAGGIIVTPAGKIDAGLTLSAKIQ